jgi:hypothetical protein
MDPWFREYVKDKCWNTSSSGETLGVGLKL